MNGNPAKCNPPPHYHNERLLAHVAIQTEPAPLHFGGVALMTYN